MDTGTRSTEGNLQGLHNECEQHRKRIDARRHIQAEKPELVNVAVAVPAAQ